MWPQFLHSVRCIGGTEFVLYGQGLRFGRVPVTVREPLREAAAAFEENNPLFPVLLAIAAPPPPPATPISPPSPLTCSTSSRLFSCRAALTWRGQTASFVPCVELLSLVRIQPRYCQPHSILNSSFLTCHCTLVQLPYTSFVCVFRHLDIPTLASTITPNFSS